VSLADFFRMKQKLMDEAKRLAVFDHPGLPRVYANFEENNTAYMVMEYLQGKTLFEILKDRGTLPEGEVVGYLKQVGEAVDYLHQRGFIHRDIKPGNIFVCDDGRIVLMDAGVVWSLRDALDAGEHEVMLTPGYAPLEQYAQRARLDAYTDIYALGATLYHLLTGEMPVSATDRAAGAELPHMRQSRPELSEPVAEAIMAALAMRVTDRPQTVQAFVAQLTGNG
jgi:serine/threonine-protein kinase